MAEPQKPSPIQVQRPPGLPAQAGPTKPQFAAESISIGLPWRLMVFSFILFLFSIFIFAGLRFGYGTYLDAQTKVVDMDIEELAAQVSESEQEELLIFYSQLANLQKVLTRRDFTRNIFPFLEENTLTLVYYTEAQYSAEEGIVSLAGFSNSTKTFVEQVTLFEQAPEIERVIIDDIGLQKGEVSFDIRLAFQPEFLKRVQ